MNRVISILLLVCWTLSSLTAQTVSPLVLDHTSHVQSVLKKNSESETPDHYQSFSEIDLNDERIRQLFLALTFLLPDENDLFWFSNLTYCSIHCHAFHTSVVNNLSTPLYILDRQILI